MKETSFAEFVAEHLDRQAYLEAYPDVQSAGVDPVRHWLEAGMAEGRAFSPTATILQGDQAKQVEGAQWQHFIWQGNPVAVRIDAKTEDQIFAEFVAEHLDRQAYLEAYPDVRSAGVDPVRHWLEAGMAEGRFLYPGATVVYGEIAGRLDSIYWKQFIWHGKAVAVRTIRPIKPSILVQINAQARHDPSVMAAGALTLGRLRQVDGPDLLARGGVDVRSIFAAIPKRPDVVVLMPFLRECSAEKYASDLIGALTALGYGNILIIITDDNVMSTDERKSFAALAPLWAANVMFWRDVCGFSCIDPKYVARLLNSLRPSKIIILNSHIGNNMISRFGRGLSQFAKLYSVYFSPGLYGLGVTASERWLYRTIPFCIAITDIAAMAATWLRQWGGLPGPGISILPLKLQPVADEIFSARLMARRKRLKRNIHSHSWVCVSHLQSLKVMAILSELAGLRPTDQFDYFGPLEGSINETPLTLPNVTRRGMVADASTADFTDYDGFVFISLIDGIPNTVLEISQHAIPMIVADVGGLRDTFDETAVFFVADDQEPYSTANAFARALDRVAELTDIETLAMIETARFQALERHAPDAYLNNISDIFGTPENHV